MNITVKIIATIIVLSIVSCNHHTNEPSTKIEKLNDDSIKKIVVDYYPITNDMLADKTSSNSQYKIQSGQTYSYEKVWFSNDSLKQTLVVELYTDYHRVVTFHFYNKDIPTDLIQNMTLHKGSKVVATLVQKINDIDGFIQQATRLNAAYFTTYNGFRLGDPKQQSLDIYGKPDKQSLHL